MAEVRWSLTASEDLQELEDFIARDSVLHAIDFVNRLVEAAEKLSDNPHLASSCQNSVALIFAN